MLAQYSVNHLLVLMEETDSWQGLSQLIHEIAALSTFKFLLQMNFGDHDDSKSS